MQNKPSQLWPWEEEDISTAEYIYALQSLNHFLTEVDSSSIQTLEDLSAVVSLVGHNLNVLVVAKGTKITKQLEYPQSTVHEPIIQRVYVLRKSIGNLELTIAARDDHHISLIEHRSTGFYQREELRIRLPSDRDIAIGAHPNIDTQSLYAIDLRGPGTQEYYPVTEPFNSELQQTFTRVLQHGIRDVASAFILT